MPDRQITAEEKKMLFEQAPITINQRQAEALAMLIWEGKYSGTIFEDVDPPRTAAILATGPKCGLTGASGLECRRDRKSGEYICEEGKDYVAMDPPLPPSNPLLVVAEDGRMWSITSGGLTWPMPMPEIE